MSSILSYPFGRELLKEPACNWWIGHVHLHLPYAHCNFALLYGCQNLPLAPQPASGFNLLIAHSCRCSWPLSLLPAGLQLVATDARVIPEELFFQLQKPPQHGSLLKSTAESSGPMAAGRYSLGSWPAWGYFFFNLYN